MLFSRRLHDFPQLIPGLSGPSGRESTQPETRDSFRVRLLWTDRRGTRRAANALAAVSATAAGIAVPTLINLGRVAAPGSVKPTNSPDNASAPYTPSAGADRLRRQPDFLQRNCRQRSRTDDRHRRRLQRSEHRLRHGHLQHPIRLAAIQLRRTDVSGAESNRRHDAADEHQYDGRRLGPRGIARRAVGALDGAEANVILFESTTANDPDMDQAEVTAAGWPGVSVISNSWGEGEFSGGNVRGSVLPARRPATRGSRSWPPPATPARLPATRRFLPTWSPSAEPTSRSRAAAPTSRSRCGTTITVWPPAAESARRKRYPSYQDGLNGINGASTTNRNVPDVSADADPNSGVYVYDTWNEGQAAAISRSAARASLLRCGPA